MILKSVFFKGLTPEVLARAAEITDLHGNFQIYPKSKEKVSYNYKVTFMLFDAELVDFMAAHFGGYRYTVPGRKYTFHWLNLQQRRALKFVEVMQEHLVVKGDLGALFLAFKAEVKSNHRRRHTEESLARRQEALEKFRSEGKRVYEMLKGKRFKPAPDEA